MNRIHGDFIRGACNPEFDYEKALHALQNMRVENSKRKKIEIIISYCEAIKEQPPALEELIKMNYRSLRRIEKEYFDKLFPEKGQSLAKFRVYY
jgi:hypothetical protein